MGELEGQSSQDPQSQLSDPQVGGISQLWRALLGSEGFKPHLEHPSPQGPVPEDKPPIIFAIDKKE